MKAPLHYFQLVNATYPELAGYHKDLLVHDRRMIRKNPTVPFIHVVREYGTYLTMLPPADAYPAKGESVPYLFAKANREHLLRETRSCLTYAERNHPDALLHYFDGTVLRQTTYAEANTLLREYANGILNQWEAETVRA